MRFHQSHFSSYPGRVQVPQEHDSDGGSGHWDSAE